jgi:hypothetical protein
VLGCAGRVARLQADPAKLVDRAAVSGLDRESGFLVQPGLDHIAAAERHPSGSDMNIGLIRGDSEASLGCLRR